MLWHQSGHNFLLIFPQLNPPQADKLFYPLTANQLDSSTQYSALAYPAKAGQVRRSEYLVISGSFLARTLGNVFLYNLSVLVLIFRESYIRKYQSSYPLRWYNL